MKALLQRVAAASVAVRDREIAKIGKGILVFLGIEKGDAREDMDYLGRKISNLRIFEDEGGKMNLSVTDAGGEVLVVSQFTLVADCRKGNRPSFDSAESLEKAEKMYREMVKTLLNCGLRVAEGKFGADMQVRLINDGPVTIWLDSRRQRVACE